jgi:hypothetical protein
MPWPKCPDCGKPLVRKRIYDHKDNENHWQFYCYDKAFHRCPPKDCKAENLPTQESGGCVVSKMVNKWGPYDYLVRKVNGKQTWKYLGKSDGSRRIRLQDESEQEEGARHLQ